MSFLDEAESNINNTSSLADSLTTPRSLQLQQLQQQQQTPSPPSRRYPRLPSLSSLLTPPRLSPVRSFTNRCQYCHQQGHWSNDCPITCSWCQRRGHEERQCEPICSACYGAGVVRREQGDERLPVLLELQGAIAGVRRAVVRLRGELGDGDDEGRGGGEGDGHGHGHGERQSVEGERCDSVHDQPDPAVIKKIQGDLASMLMFAGQVEAELSRLVGFSSGQ